MDLEELEAIFEDNDEELVLYIQNIRTYTIKERKNHMTIWNDQEFFDRFRFSKNIITNVILPQIVNMLPYDQMRMQDLNPLQQLLLTLRFYASGSFYITMGDFNGIHKTTTGRVIKRVTEALISLRATYIKFPDTQEERNQIQRKFYEISRFPKVLGAIDCTHIRIQSPGGQNAEVFRNRKGFFSLNVQGICNAEYKFLDIVCRWPGSSHDSHIFRNSAVHTRFENGEFGQSILLGDSGYPLKDYLMTPLGNPNTPAEELYNRSHISTRTIIERTFGIWKRRFPILSLGMRCRVPLAQQIILATAILHNISIVEREFLEDLPVLDIEIPFPILNQPILNIRQRRFIHYFQSLL